MGIINTLFGKTIREEAEKRVSTFMNGALTDLYTRNIFSLMNNADVTVTAETFDYIERAYSAVGACYEAVDIITKKVVACPRIVYRVKDEKEYKKYLNYSKSADTLALALIAKAKGLEEVSHKQIEALLNKPNPQQNGDDMFESLAGQFLLKGNAYVYGNSSAPANKKWSELWPIPGDMSITAGPFMQAIKEYKMLAWPQTQAIPADQIKHFKTFNPNYRTNSTELFGLSPLRAYLYSLDILKNADIQADKQLKSGGKMGFIAPESKEDQLSDPQKKDMHEQLSRARNAKDDLSRVIPVSVAMKWTEIGLASADMQLLEISGAKGDDIYRAYHIPLQFRSQDSATYNNLPVANRKFVFDAVAPICRKLEVGLTEFVCTPYNTATETFVIHLDYMSLPELSSDMVAAVQWLQNSPFLTMNEKREVIMYGRSQEEGMDLIMVNRNSVFLKDVLAGKVTQTQNDQTSSPDVN